MPYGGSATATEKWSGPTKTIQYQNNQITANALRIFDVINAVSQTDAIAATGINIGAGYPTDSLITCSGYYARQVSPKMYEVQVQYTYVPASLDYVDPLTMPPIISWDTVQYEVPIDRDIYGNPIVNGNFDPFDPPATKIVTKKVLKIQKNFAYYPYHTFTPYETCVNSDVITYTEPGGFTNVFDPGTILCTSVAPVSGYKRTDKYVPIVASFDVYVPNEVFVSTYPEKVGHQLRFLNQGGFGFYVESGVEKKGCFKTAATGAEVSNALIKADGTPYRSDLVVSDYHKTFTPHTTATALPAGAVTEDVGGIATFIYYDRYTPAPLGPLFTAFN